MVELPEDVVCQEYRGRFETDSATRPFRFICQGDERRMEVVVKLRDPGAVPGHFRSTSLANELVCAMLARQLGLCVPDYFRCRISREILQAIPPADRPLVAANLGLNFGLEYKKGMVSWYPDQETKSGSLLDCLEDVLLFDVLVLNGDRMASKPNLLWNGGNEVWLIDHSLALPFPQCPQYSSSSPLYPRDRIPNHCVFRAIRGQEREFARLSGLWRQRVTLTELTRIRDAIPPEWEQSPGDYQRIFHFLEHRHERIKESVTQLREVVR